MERGLSDVVQEDHSLTSSAVKDGIARPLVLDLVIRGIDNFLTRIYELKILDAQARRLDIHIRLY